MAQPAVNLNTLDGQLGILPAQSGRPLAIVGVSSAGPAVNTPVAYGRVSSIKSALVSGPLAHAAAHHVALTGKPVVVVRTGSTVAGAFGTVDNSNVTGDADFSADSGTEPDDDYEIVIRVVAGGTVGVAGITYQTSQDGGRNYGAVTALGTATNIVIPNTGGAAFDVTTDTLVAGDYMLCRTTAPQWNDAELTSALTALKNSGYDFEIVHVVGAVDADAFDVVHTALSGMAAVGKFCSAVCNTRVPNVGEDEATYKAALDTLYSAKASTYIEMCAGACEISSSLTGLKHLRPYSFDCASDEANVAEHIDIADPSRESRAVGIRDENGNPKHHDETVNPGLQDSRFSVLRTFNGVAGVYPNRPQLFSAEGSDFDLHAHRRVFNIALRVLSIYFLKRLNKPVRVDKNTGYILEAEAVEIENGANGVLAAALKATPKASDVTFTLSRTDNVLSSKTLTGDCSITPLAYPETFNIGVGFKNPALTAI